MKNDPVTVVAGLSMGFGNYIVAFNAVLARAAVHAKVYIFMVDKVFF